MIYCDKCKHEFTPKLRERNKGVAIKEAYFKCPKCRHHYTVCYTNQEARRLQRVVRSLSMQGKYDEALKAQGKLQAIMATLKQQFGA